MPQRWTYVFLSLLASSMVFFSCKRNYSSDDTLPVSYSPSVIVGSNNQVVYAINPKTGEKNWELGLPCPVIASPVVYKGFVYIANSNRDTIYKVNSKTGEIVKKITFGGGNTGVKATPILDGNLLYVASMGNGLFAIDTGSYNVKWSYMADGAMEASPTIHNGNIYIATVMGTVYCFEKNFGNVVSTASPVPIWSYHKDRAKFVSSPTIGEPYLYIGSLNDSNMYCLYVNPPTYGVGEARWIYKANGGIRSSPAAYGGYCIFGANDFVLYCLDSTIDPVAGQTVPNVYWADTMKSEVSSSPYAYNQVVYVGCKDYRLYALRFINGTQKWVFSTNGIITSSPVVYDGMVYVGSFDKHLYGLDTLRGTLKWKYNINGQIECSPVVDDFTKLTGHNSQISGYTN